MTKQKSRAEQIASSTTEKLVDLGQLPRPVRRATPDRETPNQIEKRRLLKAKLRSFAQD